MRRLLVYLKEYRREAVLAPLFKLLEVVFELLVPLVVAAVIDRGIGGGDRAFIVRMGLSLALLGLVGLLSATVAQFFAAKAAVGFASRVRHALFDHVQRFSYAQADAHGSATLITRMTSDVNQAQSGVNMALRLLLRSPFVVFGAVLMAFTIDVRSALVFALVVPILALVVFGLLFVSLPLYEKVQHGLDRVLGATRENLTGVRVLRAFGKEQAEIAAFERENGALYRLQRLAGGVSALMNPATYVLVNAAVLVLIHQGALRVEAGALTTGAVVALYNYMSQILVELIKLANLIVTMTKAWASGGRIQDVLDEWPEGKLDDPRPLVADVPGAARVAFERVSLTYSAGGDPALTDISFEARPGETIGVIGGTGAGKTTLINLIPRFYEATAGRVLVDGVDVRAYPIGQLRAKIGIVPQRAVLFAGTIRDNLRWGKTDATEEELARALAAAQAQDIVAAKALGLDEPVQQGGRNLSGGQRQRLCIARALVGECEILILDDSSSALDYATDARLRRALRELPSNPTVFLVSQRTASIRQADRILVLDDGRLVGVGTHDELMRACKTYREIHQSQYGKEGA